MKVAAPTSQGKIESHFGHCAEFTVFTVGENKEVVSEEQIVPPAGCGCKTEIIPDLADKGVTVMLAGNMGGGAVNMLNRFNIEVYRGLTGDARSVVDAWLAGNVVDSGTECGGGGEHGCH